MHGVNNTNKKPLIRGGNYFLSDSEQCCYRTFDWINIDMDLAYNVS
jgi:hypothetical protein